MHEDVRVCERQGDAGLPPSTPEVGRASRSVARKRWSTRGSAASQPASSWRNSGRLKSLIPRRISSPSAEYGTPPPAAVGRHQLWQHDAGVPRRHAGARRNVGDRGGS